jgi:hypothetical protein
MSAKLFNETAYSNALVATISYRLQNTLGIPCLMAVSPHPTGFLADISIQEVRQVRDRAVAVLRADAKGPTTRQSPEFILEKCRSM